MSALATGHRFWVSSPSPADRTLRMAVAWGSALGGVTLLVSWIAFGFTAATLWIGVATAAAAAGFGVWQERREAERQKLGGPAPMPFWQATKTSKQGWWLTGLTIVTGVHLHSAIALRRRERRTEAAVSDAHGRGSSAT